MSSTPLMWRLDTFWRAFRDQTPWIEHYPSEYLAAQVRFCTSRLEGPSRPEMTAEWLEQMDKEKLLMFASDYPYWTLARPDDLPTGITDDQRHRILGANAADLYGFAAPVEA